MYSSTSNNSLYESGSFNNGLYIPYQSLETGMYSNTNSNGLYVSGSFNNGSRSFNNILYALRSFNNDSRSINNESRSFNNGLRSFINGLRSFINGLYALMSFILDICFDCIHEIFLSRSVVVGYTSGILFTVGWWFFFDALIYSKYNKLEVQIDLWGWFPGLISTLSLIMYESIFFIYK